MSDFTLFDRIEEFAGAFFPKMWAIVLGGAGAVLWEKIRENQKRWSKFNWLVVHDKKHWISFSILLLGTISAAFLAYDDINVKYHDEMETPNKWRPLTNRQKKLLTEFAQLENPDETTKISIMYLSACSECRELAEDIQKTLSKIHGYEIKEPTFADVWWENDKNFVMKPEGLFITRSQKAPDSSVYPVVRGLSKANIPFITWGTEILIKGDAYMTIMVFPK